MATQIFNRKNEVMTRVWIQEKDKKKIEKLAKNRKLYFWEMIEEMLKNYKED